MGVHTLGTHGDFCVDREDCRLFVTRETPTVSVGFSGYTRKAGESVEFIFGERGTVLDLLTLDLRECSVEAHDRPDRVLVAAVERCRILL